MSVDKLASEEWPDLTVSGAGSDEWNGKYEHHGIRNGKPAYCKVGSACSLQWVVGIIDAWAFQHSFDGDAGYSNDANTTKPPSSGWKSGKLAGASALPAPTLDDGFDIDGDREDIGSLQLRCEASELAWATLHVSSHDLTDVEYVAWEPKFSSEEQRRWEAWCPCCKKPIDIVAWRRYLPSCAEKTWQGTPRYAYAAAIWGDGNGLSGFVLGALVLGLSLNTKSGYDRVLMHTDDVPSTYLSELAKLWRLVCVPRIKANPDLFTSAFEGHRFDGVFTKLHALSLVDYDKVVMMDIDLAVLDCPDDLFQLQAPAAMRRGNSASQHGEPIHGRSFFGGQKYGWGQSGGINAGVMLFEPNMKDFDRMLIEVSSERHPERVPGNGPEQDYLSRYYAPKWHHISLLFNFQIHHILHSLEAALKAFNGIDDFGWWLYTNSAAGDSGEAEIRHGTRLRCISTPSAHKPPIYESPYSYNVVGEVGQHEYIDAIGRVVNVKQHRMVPVKVQQPDGERISDIGFVDLSWFEVDAASLSTSDSLHPQGGISDGTILRCIATPSNHEGCGLPVFEQTYSWTEIGYIEVDNTMIASGPAEIIQNCALVPIKHPYSGFVNGRCVDVVPNDVRSSHLDCQHAAPAYRDNGQIHTCFETTTDDDVNVWIPERLALDPKDVHIVHFSGVVKMWDRDFLRDETDEQFVDRFLKSNSCHSAKLWLEKAGDISDYAEYGIRLKDNSFELLGSQQGRHTDSKRKNAVNELVSRGVANTMTTALRAAKQWRTDVEALPASLGHSSLSELMDTLSRGSFFSYGDKVQVFWLTENRWYGGIVEAWDSCGGYIIKFDDFDGYSRIEHKYLKKAL